MSKSTNMKEVQSAEQSAKARAVADAQYSWQTEWLCDRNFNLHLLLIMCGAAAGWAYIHMIE